MLLHFGGDPVRLDLFIFPLVSGSASFGADAPANAPGNNLISLITVNALSIDNDRTQGEFAFLFHNIHRTVCAGNRFIDFNRFQPEPVPSGVEGMYARANRRLAYR